MITDGRQAELILRTGQADGVFIGRAALADPRWWQRGSASAGLRSAPGSTLSMGPAAVYLLRNAKVCGDGDLESVTREIELDIRNSDLSLVLGELIGQILLL